VNGTVATDSALDALERISVSKMQAEIAELRAIAAWARNRAGIDYEVGDRVVIASEEPSRRASHKRHKDGTMSGWYRYREALAVGQTGIVRDVYFSARRQAWCVNVGLDRSWSIDETHDWLNNTTTYERRWKGPVAELPEGYVLPCAYDVEHYPDGEMQVFFMDADWVRKDVPGAVDFGGCDR